MKDTRLKLESICAGCGKITDAALMIYGNYRPKPGDIAICMDCGHVAAYADNLTIRPLTDKEMYEIAGDKKILELQALLGGFNKYRKKNKL